MRLIAVLLLATASVIWSQPAYISAELRSLDAHSAVDVIVRFKHTPSEDQHRLVRQRGGVYNGDLRLVEGALYSQPASAIESLAQDPEVVSISPDREVHGALDLAVPTVGADIAFSYGWTGAGIGVAVIDSGIANHPDLKGAQGHLRVVYSQDFIGGGTDDHYGHGQHVAGIIAGSAQSSSGKGFTHMFRGVAPAADLVNLRVLDQNGDSKDSVVIAAIQAINLKTKYNIRDQPVPGRPVSESYKADPLCQAVEQAWQAGIVVVVAAGNYGRDDSAGTAGYGTITSPANDPDVITVGAMKTMGTSTRADDLIASYSSKGPTLIDHIVKPDLVAPGNRMISLLASTAQLENQYPANAVPLTYYENTGSGARSNEYYRMSGTSMAAPMVSGAAVLLLQQNPHLTPDQIKARLMKTASKSFPSYSVATDPTTGITYTSQ